MWTRDLILVVNCVLGLGRATCGQTSKRSFPLSLEDKLSRSCYDPERSIVFETQKSLVARPNETVLMSRRGKYNK